MRRMIAVLGWLAWATSATADVSFTLQDYLHHRWREELVTYRVDPSQIPEPARLLGPEGRVQPVQIRRLGRQAEVAFLVRELPADGRLTYRLTAGTPVGRPLAQVVEGGLLLDGGAGAALVPAPGVHPAAGRSLAELPAPLLRLRAARGPWLGAGRLVGERPVKSARTTLLAAGPVYAEARTDYELEGGHYAMTVRVVAGQPVVLVSEEFDLPPAAGECFFQYDLRPGLEPTRLAAQGRLWRPRLDPAKVWPNTAGARVGDDYRLDYSADRRELRCIGYSPWWLEVVRLFTLHAGPTDTALSFFPTRIGDWRNPMGAYLETRRDGALFLSLPLYIRPTWEEDGIAPASPFYTGRLEPGWPPTALRRHWAFALASERAAFPEAGQSEVARQILKYSDLPLDKIKDWTFAWDATGVKYPRLYVDPEDLAGARARARQVPGWDEALGAYYTRPRTYVLTGDPQVGDQLLHAEPPEQNASWYATAGALPGLRYFVANLFDNWGYVGFPSPNNAAPMNELLRFDAAMAVAEATPAERAELQALAAFVAQMVADPDWHAVGSGWTLGNVNMPPRQEHHLAVAARALPTHPSAPAWRARGVAEQQRQLADMVRPSGAWRECPHYQFEAALYPLIQAAVPLRLAGAPTAVSDPRLKQTLRYLVNLLTPPDPRFAAGERQLRTLPAFGNSSWEFMPLTGWLAALTAAEDPAFSREMMWAWEAQGRPTWFQMSPLVLDPSLPAQPPELHSTLYEGFGAVLRSGFPSEAETWVAFRHGDCIEHYNYGDQGSFMLFAQGAPLVLHFGSQYTPYFRGAWHFNRACVNHRPVTPADGPAYQTLVDYGLDPAYYDLGTEAWLDTDHRAYPMHNRGFFRGEQADYARGEQVQSFQSVEGQDPTHTLPPKYTAAAPTVVPAVPIPTTSWNRRLALLKDPDPRGPNYLVIRDDLLGEGDLPGEWNLWLLAEDLQTAENRATVTSRYGVVLDIFMAEPWQPRWSTRQATNEFIAGPSVPYVVEKPWREVLTNLRAEQAPHGGFLAVLYPRRADQPPPVCTVLAEGRGVQVVTPRGTDWVFLSQEPLVWAGEGLAFAGTAGAIRRVGDRWTAVFLEPGQMTVHGRTLRSDRAQEVALEG